MLCRDVEERLTPALIGADPLAITRALGTMEKQLPDGQLAIAGVEMALTAGMGGAIQIRGVSERRPISPIRARSSRATSSLVAFKLSRTLATRVAPGMGIT